MSLMLKIMQLQEIALCVVRKWWRPIACIGIAGTVWVNGVMIPLMTKTTPDLTGLAALVTAVAAAFAVREWGKIKGVKE